MRESFTDFLHSRSSFYLLPCLLCTSASRPSLRKPASPSLRVLVTIVETSPLASVTRACEVPLLTRRMSPGSTQRGAQDSRGKGRDQALRQVKPNASTQQQGSVETDKKTTTTEDKTRFDQTVPNPSSRDNT